MILAFGVAFYLFLFGMIQGVVGLSFDNLINFETGHFKVRTASYDPDRPFAEESRMTNYREVYTRLEGEEFITAMTRRVMR